MRAMSASVVDELGCRGGAGGRRRGRRRRAGAARPAGRSGPRRLRDRGRPAARPSRCGRRRATSPRASPPAIESDHLASVDVAGPGFPQPARVGGLVPGRRRAHPDRRAALRLRHRRHAAADPGRVRVRQPDRPGHRRDGAQCRLRRQPGAAVRVRRPRGRSRVLLQRRRPPDRAVRRVAAGAGARHRAARRRLPRRVRGGDRGRARARPRGRCRRSGRGPAPTR